MDETGPLSADDALAMLRARLPSYSFSTEPLGHGEDATIISLCEPDGSASLWNLIVWERYEMLFSFGSGRLRAELEGTAEDVEWCAMLVLATSAGHFVHESHRLRDRLAVTLADGTVARFSTMPGTPRAG